MVYPLLSQKTRGVLQEERGLVPNLGMVAETEHALLEREHDPLGQHQLILDLHRVGLLPCNVFLPKLNLEVGIRGRDKVTSTPQLTNIFLKVFI